MDAFSNFWGEVKRFVLYYLVERLHETIKSVCAVHLFRGWHLSHERDWGRSQHFELVDDLSRLLVSHFELIHLEVLPSVNFLAGGLRSSQA